MVAAVSVWTAAAENGFVFFTWDVSAQISPDLSPSSETPLGKIALYQVKEAIALTTPAEFLVSSSGQMSVPAAVRHRWGLDRGGSVTVFDLGDAVVLLPPGARKRLLAAALTADEHRRFVRELDDPDLATT